MYRTLILLLLLCNVLKANEKVTLQLDWLHQFQFAGYYVAKEKGYYQNKGLDVSIKEFDFSTNLLMHVLDNESAYAVGKSSLLIDRITDKNIVALAAIYQHSPMVLLTRKDSGIDNPKDLYKKKVMLTPDARLAVAINSMISSQGVKLSDVNFIPHSFKLDDLINGHTDAMGCYLSNEPYILKKKNIDFNILNPRDYGFDFYGGILFTSEQEVLNHPQRVRDFYEASLQGWHYAFSHIVETAKLIKNKYNSQNKSLESLIYEGRVLSNLAEFNKGNLGTLSYKKYEEILKIYSLLGYEHSPTILNKFIYNPNTIILTPKEKEYLKNTTVLYQTSMIKPFTIDNKSGLEFEYLNLIKELIPIKIKFVNQENNNYDMKLAFSKKPNVLLSQSMTQYPFAIVTKSDINYIQSLKNLNGKKVAILKNSIFDIYFKTNYPNIDFIVLEEVEKACDLLDKEYVFAVLESMPIMLEHIAQTSHKKIKISGMTKLKHDIQFEMHEPILESIINKTIAQIEQNKIDTFNAIYLAPKQQAKQQNNTLAFKIILPIIIILVIILFFNRRLSKESKKREALEQSVQKISSTDALTNIHNRKMSITLFENSIEISKRYKRPLSIILFDIDDFKLINENYSYEVGDQVLKELVTLIQTNIRSTDIFGRWEGEEFLLILPESNSSQAQTTAEHLKELVYNYDFEKLKTYITCSFAVVEYQINDDSNDTIMRASKLLENIKNNNKNSVKVG